LEPIAAGCHTNKDIAAHPSVLEQGAELGEVDLELLCPGAKCLLVIKRRVLEERSAESPKAYLAAGVHLLLILKCQRLEFLSNDGDMIMLFGTHQQVHVQALGLICLNRIPHLDIRKDECHGSASIAAIRQELCVRPWNKVVRDAKGGYRRRRSLDCVEVG
jgi:hypothetical protein